MGCAERAPSSPKPGTSSPGHPFNTTKATGTFSGPANLHGNTGYLHGDPGGQCLKDEWVKLGKRSSGKRNCLFLLPCSLI